MDKTILSEEEMEELTQFLGHNEHCGIDMSDYDECSCGLQEREFALIDLVNSLIAKKLEEREIKINFVKNYIGERIKQHESNLENWQEPNGLFIPTEPEEEERENIRRELIACIEELKGLKARYFKS